jgi:hypothetical protein
VHCTRFRFGTDGNSRFEAGETAAKTPDTAPSTRFFRLSSPFVTEWGLWPCLRDHSGVGRREEVQGPLERIAVEPSMGYKDLTLAIIRDFPIEEE